VRAAPGGPGRADRDEAAATAAEQAARDAARAAERAAREASRAARTSRDTADGMAKSERRGLDLGMAAARVTYVGLVFPYYILPRSRKERNSQLSKKSNKFKFS
jgi:hypothetical protein